MKQQILPLPLGGQFSAGDPSLIPPEASRLEQNVVSRPGRWEKRSALVSAYPSNLANGGLAYWNSVTSGSQQIVFLLNNNTLNTGSTSYANSNLSGSAVTDFTNYKGALYYCIANSGSGLVPTGMSSFNGTSSSSNPFNSAFLHSRTISAFIDRLFLGHVYATVTNEIGATNINLPYDPTLWSAVTTTRESINNTGRITPTAATGSMIYLPNMYLTSGGTATFRCDLRNTSATYAMPVTVETYYSYAWVGTTAYPPGEVRVPTAAAGNGFRYRATVAGISAAGEPVWPVVLGATVVDGTVTWVCDGTDAASSTTTTIPTTTDARTTWTTIYSTGNFLNAATVSKVGVRIKFGNVGTPSVSLVAIEMSYKDGLADPNPLKANRGQQLTAGAFKYPFFNKQASNVSEIKLDGDIFWTETSDPQTIRGSNYYVLREAPGEVMAMAVVGGRLVVFKRQGMWIFQGSADPDNPIIKERFMGNFGCVGPRALTVFEDTLYFISDSEIFAYRPGGAPKPICGDGMREEILNHAIPVVGSVGWIAGAADALQDLAGITVDQANRDLLVSSQYAKLYAYQIDREQWSILSATNAAAAASQMKCPTWSGGTRLVYTQDQATAAMLDPTVATPDFGTQSCISKTTFRPIDVGSDIIVDEIHVSTLCTGSQAGQTFTVGLSFDDGSTFPKTNSVVLPVSATATKNRTVIPLRQMAPRPVIQLTHSGNAGAAAFAIASAEAQVRVLRPERTTTTPTQGSSSL